MSDTTPEPVVVDRPDRQRYEILVGDELGGFIAYQRHGQVVDLVHTEVDPAFEGHGLGGKLAQGAFDDLRARGLQLIPTCPFIRGYLERHPAQLDLVVPDHRRTFEP
jgi:predicted GNAT family acetyltransferase